MNNLQKFKEFELSSDEIVKVKGGGLYDWIAGYVFGKAVDWTVNNLLTKETMVEYGRRMYETGSPGGAK